MLASRRSSSKTTCTPSGLTCLSSCTMEVSSCRRPRLPYTAENSLHRRLFCYSSPQPVQRPRAAVLPPRPGDVPRNVWRLDAAPVRHSAITHLAEDNVALPMLMAKSRHTSLRSLHNYAPPGADAVAALTAAHDPERRRR